MLCVPEADLAAYERRYQRYLQRPARVEGSTRVFDLEASRLTLLPASALGEILPGEESPAPPAFVACTVAVRDLEATRALLDDSGLPVRTVPSGGLFVPAPAARGAAVVFTPAPTPW